MDFGGKVVPKLGLAALMALELCIWSRVRSWKIFQRLLFLWISGYLDWLHAQRVETLGGKMLCSPCAQAMQLFVMLVSGQEGHSA